MEKVNHPKSAAAGSPRSVVAGNKDASAQVPEPGSRCPAIRLAVLCVLGLAGAQTWVPVADVLADAYRLDAFHLASLAWLVIPYLTLFAVIAVAFTVQRVKAVYLQGVYGVLTGALFSCVGIAVLLLAGDAAADRAPFILLLAGALLGGGGGLMVMVWCSVVEELPDRLPLICALVVVFACCALAALVQVVYANILLSGATVALIAVSVVCHQLTVHLITRSSTNRNGGGWRPATDAVPGSRKADMSRRGIITQGLGVAFGRLVVSFGCFGFSFTMMIMQFMVAPHGKASPFTWLFGFAGIAIALLCFAASRAIRTSWDFLFVYRFAAILLIVAFFPLDPALDPSSAFSLRFALCFSTMALWFFLTVVPGVIWDVAVILRIPAFAATGAGLGGLCTAAALGYLVALSVIELGDLAGYFISVTAIIAMAIGLVGSNIAITRGSLVRAFRRASVVSGEPDDADAAMREKVGRAVKAHGLTEREADVLAILARGYGLTRIQEDLFISEGTALTHKRHIYQKLDVHSKSELIDRVASFGIDDCEED